MKMNININKETVKTGLTVAGKIGKAIVIEGIKGVLLKSAATAITTSFDSGIEGVKKLTVDDYIGGKKKRDMFSEIKSKPKEAKVVVEAEFEPVEKRDQEK